MSAERKFLIWSAALVGFFVLLYALSSILLPFVAAVLIAYVFSPVPDRLERWGVPRWATAGIVIAVVILLIILFFFLFVPLLQTELARAMGKLPDYVVLLRDKLESLTFAIERRITPEDADKLRDAVGGLATEAVAWSAGAIKGILTSGIALFNFLSLVLLTPLIAFYLLRDWNVIVGRIDSWLPRGSAPTIRAQVREIDLTLSAFIRGQATVCAMVAAFYSVALTAMGLDFGITVGLLAGLLTFVPFLGFLVGFVLSVGLAAAQFGTWDMIGLAAGIFVVGQIVEGNFLTPKIVGGKVGLHEVWVIFALLAGGELLGFVGVLLAVPIAATIGVLARFALTRYRASPLFRSDGRAPGGE